jgi:hypothetical protein
MTWSTPDGDRVLQGAERKLFMTLVADALFNAAEDDLGLSVFSKHKLSWFTKSCPGPASFLALPPASRFFLLFAVTGAMLNDTPLLQPTAATEFVIYTLLHDALDYLVDDPQAALAECKDGDGDGTGFGHTLVAAVQESGEELGEFFWGDADVHIPDEGEGEGEGEGGAAPVAAVVDGDGKLHLPSQNASATEWVKLLSSRGKWESVIETVQEWWLWDEDFLMEPPPHPAFLQQLNISDIYYARDPLPYKHALLKSAEQGHWATAFLLDESPTKLPPSYVRATIAAMAKRQKAQAKRPHAKAQAVIEATGFTFRHAAAVMGAIPGEPIGSHDEALACAGQQAWAGDGAGAVAPAASAAGPGSVIRAAAAGAVAVPLALGRLLLRAMMRPCRRVAPMAAAAGGSQPASLPPPAAVPAAAASARGNRKRAAPAAEAVHDSDDEAPAWGGGQRWAGSAATGASVAPAASGSSASGEKPAKRARR